MNIIVKDKSKLNVSKARKQLNSWMKIDFTYLTFEFHYSKIQPRIIAEAYIEEADSLLSSDLIDYKFLCFGGEPYYCWVDLDRGTGHIKKYI